MKVNIIIAGFQKCGTTALHSFLSDHPDIIGSKPKESDFFNSDFRYAQGKKFYHSYFKHRSSNPFNKKLYLESSPSYLHKGNVEETAKRIKAYNKDVKVIAVVRNPIDRAFSAWNMYRKNYEKGKENWWFEWVEERDGYKVDALKRDAAEYEDFHLYITREMECIANNKKIECPVLPIGFYEGIAHFQDAFKDNFIVISNEDLQARTGCELEKLAEFLQLKEHNWKKFEGKKVFSGDYKRKISLATENLLNDFYGIAQRLE